MRDFLALDRTKLANERTLLAYIRTALAFVVTGVGLLKFFTDLSIRVSGIGAIVLGVLVGVIGIVRFVRTGSKVASHYRGNG